LTRGRDQWLAFDDLSPAPRESALPRDLHELFEVNAGDALASAMQQLIDDLPEQIALLDSECTILAANRAWCQIVEDYGYTDILPGMNYRTFCVAKAVEGYEPAAEALAALDDLCSGKRSFWQLIYNGRDKWNGRDFEICIHRVDNGGPPLLLVTRSDLTEILELRRLKNDFFRSITDSQAAERERLGRELHDSTSQLLTAIGLALGRLKAETSRTNISHVVDELQGLLAETHQEIRLISYLAHVPALEKVGLTSALRSLIEGFGRRTRLEASFQVDGHATPLPPESEMSIYRIAQEALSNVHRHAHASRVHLFLHYRRGAAHLVIADNGIGISAEVAAGTASLGVGLSSMRSRLAEIGGRLSIRRLDPGTAIVASFGLESAPTFLLSPTSAQRGRVAKAKAGNELSGRPSQIMDVRPAQVLAP
jgi:signal transduction histidine kinase